MYLLTPVVLCSFSPECITPVHASRSLGDSEIPFCSHHYLTTAVPSRSLSPSKSTNHLYPWNFTWRSTTPPFRCRYYVKTH